MKDIEAGDVLLVSNNTILANLIKKILQSKYSHGAIVMYVEKENCWVAETTAEGFTVKEYSKNLLKESENIGVLRYIGGLTEEEKEKLRLEIAKRLGRKYDTADLIRLGIYYILRLNIRYKNAKKLTCTEVVERCFRAINKPLCPDIVNPEDVTPKDLANSEYLEFVFKEG